MSTMRDVAAVTGVSAKTVSRVLSNDRYVSADVRQRVTQAVEQLGYRPNLLAKTFRSGLDAAIGVAVPDIADAFFGQVTRAVEQIARARGVAVLVTSLGDDPVYESPAVEALLSRQLIGLIIAPVTSDQSYLAPWQPRTTFVFIDRPPRGLHADSVVEDDSGGAGQAIAHLVARGHRRIAFVGDSLTVPTTDRRLQGYQMALEQSGLDVDQDLIALRDAQQLTPQEVMSRFYALSSPPTAIFSSNARASLALVQYLHQIGRTDLAVVSFGDFPMADSLTPPVTVIDQDPDGLGQFAAKRLFQRVDSPTERLRRHTVLPVTLVVRGTGAATPADRT